MKVSLLGSTGLVGNEVLKLLLEEKAVETVYCVNRHPVHYTHPKLIEFLQSPLSPLEFPEEFYSSEALICCLGSTIKKSKTSVAFREVDYFFPLESAECFKKAEGKHFILLSALGANEKSNVFYNRVKGEVERDIKNLDLNKLSIVQPSLLLGERNESRPLEWTFQKLMPLFANPFLWGKWKKYRAVSAQKVAQLLLNLALNRHNSTSIEYLTI